MSVLFTLCLTFQSHGQGAAPLEQVLPDKTLVFIEVPRLSEFRKEFKLTSIGKLWADPIFDPFKKELKEHGEDWETRIQNIYGLTPSEIFAAVDGRLVVAGIQTTKGDLSFTFFLHVSDEQHAKALAEKAIKHLQSKGCSVIESSLPGTAQLLQTPDGKDQIAFFNLDKHLVISGDAEIAKSLCERWEQAEPEASLAKMAEFQDCMKQSSGETPSALRWFINPMYLAVAANFEKSQTKAAKAKMSDPRPFPLRHGFPGIRGIAGQLWLNQAPFDLSGRIAIHSPQPREQVLRALDFVPGELSFGKSIPAGVSSCTLFRWNLASILPHVGDVYDDITDSPGALKGTLEDFKKEIGVDLENVVFPMLGPQMCIYNLPDDQLRRERSLVSIEIKDPAKNEAKAAAAVYGLLAEDTETRRRRLPGQKYELWQVRLRAAGAEQALSNAGVMVAKGQLWLSSHDSLIEEVVLNRFPEDLSKTEDFKEFEAVWQPLADPQTQVAWNFSRSDLGMKQVYRALREEGIEGLEATESIYASLLLKLLSKSEQSQSIDYKTLPEFELIQKYFGLFGVCFHSRDAGWLATFGTHAQP